MSTNVRRSTAAVICGFVAMVSAVSNADIVTLQTGLSNAVTGTYTGMNYEVIISSTPNQNYGTTTSIQAGSVTGEKRKALIRFDLSAFSGYTVQGDATFTLYQRNPFGAQTDMSLYQISAANAGWIQGNGGNPADPGEAAWNFKIQGAPQTAWAGSAGLSTSGTDYLATALNTFTYVPGVNGTAVNITIAAAVLQGWIDNPSSNAGMLLVADTITAGQYGTFYNSAATQSVRPKLVFTAVAIPEATTMGLFGVSSVALLLARRFFK